jgi:predicted transcriptional regulator
MITDMKGINIPDFLIVMKWLEKEGKCMSDLHDELGIAYKHLHELKKTFLELNWISIQKNKSRHDLYLTEKGRDIISVANRLFSTMGYSDLDIMNFIERGKIKK